MGHMTLTFPPCSVAEQIKIKRKEAYGQSCIYWKQSEDQACMSELYSALGKSWIKLDEFYLLIIILLY